MRVCAFLPRCCPRHRPSGDAKGFGSTMLRYVGSKALSGLRDDTWLSGHRAEHCPPASISWWCTMPCGLHAWSSRYTFVTQPTHDQTELHFGFLSSLHRSCSSTARRVLQAMLPLNHCMQPPYGGWMNAAHASQGSTHCIHMCATSAAPPRLTQCHLNCSSVQQHLPPPHQYCVHMSTPCHGL
jgi:hypothetical protein